MRRAFSLVELIVAVAVIGIIAVAGGLRFSHALQHHRAELSAELLRSSLEEAKATARQQNAPVTFTFVKNASTYTITGIDNPDKPGRPYVVNLDAVAPGAKLSANATVTINGYGYLTADRTLELNVSGVTKYLQLSLSNNSVTITN